MTPAHVKRIRKKLGLTQTEFAKLLRTTQVTVARWESGVSLPEGPTSQALRAVALLHELGALERLR